MPQKSNQAFDQLVGARIRGLRIMRGISQTTLAERGGVTFQQVQKYEKGTNRVSPSRLAAFAEALQVDPAYFFQSHASIAVRDDPLASEILAFTSSREGINLAQAFDKLTPTERRAVVHLVQALIDRRVAPRRSRKRIRSE